MIGQTLDIFNQDAFNVISLTNLINQEDYLPGRLGELGLFAEEGIPDLHVSVEEDSSVISLVASKPRGGPGTPFTDTKRKVRLLRVPHFPLTDRVTADEVQSVRRAGTVNEVETVQNLVNRRNVRMGRNLMATIEYHRVLAVTTGIVLDKDGTTLLNLYDEFGVSAQSEVDFDLDNGSPASGAVRKVCNGVIRTIEDALGAAMYSGIMAICSSQFFDDLTAHKEVRETYQAQNAEQLRARVARRSLFYGGIMFEEYRGKVGSTSYVADNKAHIFPVGVQDLFLTKFAPADYIETVNQMGRPLYAKQAVDAQFQKFVDLEVQSNWINICTKPRVLVPAKRT